MIRPGRNLAQWAGCDLRYHEGSGALWDTGDASEPCRCKQEAGPGSAAVGGDTEAEQTQAWPALRLVRC